MKTIEFAANWYRPKLSTGQGGVPINFWGPGVKGQDHTATWRRVIHDSFRRVGFLVILRSTHRVAQKVKPLCFTSHLLKKARLISMF